MDGRYTLQGRLESGKEFEINEIPKFNPRQILSRYKRKMKLGFDPKLFTFQSLRRHFLPEFKLIAIKDNLIDQLYKNKKVKKKVFSIKFKR